MIKYYDTDIRYTGSGMIARTTGSDPNLCINSFNGTQTSDVTMVSIKLYSSVRSSINIYYTTNLDGRMTESKSSAYFEVLPGKNIINIPADRIKGWGSGELRLLRVDPLSTVGDIELDYVALFAQ